MGSGKEADGEWAPEIVKGALPSKGLTPPVGLRDARSAADPLRRVLDVGVATLALVLLLPLLLLSAALIFLEDGSPVLYRQSRVGRGGRLFTLVKLRSMKQNGIPTSEIGQVRLTDPLVTRMGRLLRRLKIDELPQLLNVLSGEMSLVGPRPTIPEQVAQYSTIQWRRLAVRPGLTGWAQINGNIELSWRERMFLDVWYVDHRSLLLDARILARTVLVVLTGERRSPAEVTRARKHFENLQQSSQERNS